MKATIIALFTFIAGAVLAGCTSLPVAPIASSTTSEEAIAAAVEATLTAVAADPESAASSLSGTPMPAQSQPPIQLPPPVENWQTFADKPGTTRGSADAPVVLVEYSDFQCPWCGRFHTEVMPELEPLIESGELRFVYKHFPVLGPDSVTAALAAECAAAQGDFWTLHDWLFDDPAGWKGSGNARELFLGAAAELGYDVESMATCVAAEETNQIIGADYRETQQLGFRGTPSFLINGRPIGGFLPADSFTKLIDVALREAKGEDLPEGYTQAPTPVPPDTDFDEEEFSVAGDPNAPVTVVEFSDYQCPFCLRFFDETKAQLDQQYVETGKVRFIYKDFPIGSIHAQARSAAEAAECAGTQGEYWAMHDRIFEGQAEWAENAQAVDIFKGYAAELALDTGAFDACLDNGVYADEVQADLEEGQRADVSGTPTFFINGQKVVGAQPFSVLQQVIEDELNKYP